MRTSNLSNFLKFPEISQDFFDSGNTWETLFILGVRQFRVNFDFFIE